MALQKQKVPLELTAGIDTKSDEFNSVSFKNVENFRYNKPGALNKVPGYTAYLKDLYNLGSGQPAITDGSAIYSFKDELLLNTSEQFLSYNGTVQKWVSKNYSNVNNTSFASPISRTGITYVNTTELETINYIDRDTVPDYFTNTQYSAVVAADPGLGGIKIQIYENAASVKILDSFIPNAATPPYDKLSPTNRNVKIVGIYNNNLYIATYLSAAANTVFYIYDLSTPNTRPTTASVAFLDFAICALNESTGVIYMVGNNGTTIRVGSLNINTLAFASANYVQTISQIPRFIDLLSSNSTFRVTGEDSTTDNVHTIVFLQSTLAISVARVLWEIANLFTTCNDGNNTYLIHGRNTTVSAFGDGTRVEALNATGVTNILGGNLFVSGYCEILGKALYDSGYIYFNASQGQVSTKSAFVLVSKTNSTTYTNKFKVDGLTTNTNAEIIGQSGYFNTTVWNVTGPATGLYRNIKIFKVDNTLKFINVTLAEFYSGDNASFVEYQKNKVLEVTHNILNNKTAEVATNDYLIIPSSVPKMYDGRNLVENGFTCSPNFMAAVDFFGVGAGTAFPTGVYGFAAVYKWQDNNGNFHYSVPEFISMTVGIANLLSVTMDIRNLGLTTKDDVYIELYATQAGGSVYYKIPKIILNNKYIGKTNVQVFALEVGVAANEILYTAGGVLENDLAPASTTSASFKNRIFLASNSSIYYSKIIEPNIPINFYADFLISGSSNNKNITGLKEMDNVLVIFYSDSIRILSGEGPNNLGEQSDYNVPQQVSSDVGCTDSNSIVSTPDGIMFKSEKGIYLLNRGLYVSYVGAGVEAYNNEIVLDAQLLNNTNEVRFLTATKILSYDYFSKQWSVFTNVNSTAADAISHDNAYHYLRSNGTVYKQVDTIFTNAGSYYSGKLETNWITVAGLTGSGTLARAQQGFQRLYAINILGKYKSAHNLIVSVAYNYDDAVIDTATLTPSAGTYQWIVKPTVQKCESFKLIIQDTTHAGTGESLVLSNLLLEVGIKGTPQKQTGDGSSAPTV